MSAQHTPGPVHVEYAGGRFRVHFLAETGAADRVEQSVIVHRKGGTGFAWRRVHMYSPLAHAAIAKAQQGGPK